jgi:hypothetical protein
LGRWRGRGLGRWRGRFFVSQVLHKTSARLRAKPP